MVDTESSDGQGHVFEDEPESDGDHDEDEDYVMEDKSDKSDPSDGELDDVVHELIPKRSKGKTINVSLFLFSTCSLITAIY